MGELDRTRALDDAALDPKNYWPSLIGAALSRGLLSDADMARIQGESAALFVRQAERLTRGESTSLRAERARELTDSIACVLGASLRRCPGADAALETLRREPLDAIFDRGLTIIRRRLGRARAVHERLKETLFVTRNVFYKSTIVDGLDAFFRLYRPEFSAQEIHITADYPAFLIEKSWRGIDFIERYLHALSCENRFLRFFDAGAVHRLLCGLDENYQQILMNIYEPVLTSALCCALTGRPVQALDADRAAVRRLLGGLDAAGVEGRLSAAREALCARLNCPAGLADYMRDSVPKIARTLVRAIEMDALDAVLLAPYDSSCAPRVELPVGERMADRDYAALLDAFTRCGSGAERAALIEARVRSAGDLAELLHDGALNGGALDDLLARLPAEALAMLRALYPCGDFLTDARDKALYDALERSVLSLEPDMRRRLDEMTAIMRKSTE